jgi:AraC family transcriptional regulator
MGKSDSEPPARPGSKACGEYLGDRFWLEKPRSHVTRSLRRGVLAVTQIKSDLPTPEPSQSIGYDEAYLVGLMVSDVPNNQLWQEGRAARPNSLKAGSTALFDLRRDPINYTQTAHYSLHFYLPRTVLIELAEQAGQRFDGELCYDFAIGYDDPVIRHLGAALLPALERGETLDGLLLDHILYAVGAHVIQQYGDMGPTKSPARGGLTRWQEKRVKQLMSANLGSNVSLKRLADECGLSVTYFARAFRQSTRTSPHRWLQQRRIEKAITMLSSKQLPLADVAIECGFADQSHFTRVFTKHVGVAPGQWRREQNTGAPPPTRAGGRDSGAS